MKIQLTIEKNIAEDGLVTFNVKSTRGDRTFQVTEQRGGNAEGIYNTINGALEPAAPHAEPPRTDRPDPALIIDRPGDRHDKTNSNENRIHRDEVAKENEVPTIGVADEQDPEPVKKAEPVKRNERDATGTPGTLNKNGPKPTRG
jgi:hypothetical protein